MLNELEGLARGADARDCPPASRAALNPEHVARVAESAKAALAFARSRNPAIRCLTTRGTVLTSSTFTVEEDVDKVSEEGRTGERSAIRYAYIFGLSSNCIWSSPRGYLEANLLHSIVDRSRICDVSLSEFLDISLCSNDFRKFVEVYRRTLFFSVSLCIFICHINPFYIPLSRIIWYDYHRRL